MAKINGTSGSDTLNGSSETDRIYGYEGNDLMRGYDGNDFLFGGAGADTMAGGSGADTYRVDNTGDTVAESVGEGTDLVKSSISCTLWANVENLTLTETSNINGTGNDLNNRITGNTGNNILTGGAGIDTLIGGSGRDYYYVDNSSDRVIENLAEGVDAVFSSANYLLPANVEDLYLRGTSDINGTGNDLGNWITGNSGNNILIGGAGNDQLDGDQGDDRLIGGRGHDIYWVDSAGDLVEEISEEGVDLVYSFTSYILPANVEDLELMGIAAINGTGNRLNNWITGNSGDNTLSGLAGSDWIDGWSGNDRLFGGYGNDRLFGGAGNDTINGWKGNDKLKGGSGTDTLTGGAGSDTFVFDAVAYGVDTITDFTLCQGNDLLDLNAFGITADADHLQFSFDGVNTTVSVDIDGTGINASFVEIAVLQGVAISLCDTANYLV
ncbi:MAG: calcium-binding protein [Thermodesulfovibrionales bacterium]|jgi:Ca2+-binding RTX toxin-like protein